MQPTLPGDVLLLAVGDRAGYRTRGAVETVLGGALLCDAVLADRAPLLGAKGKQRRKELERLVLDRGSTAVDEVGGLLCAAGVLAPLEHRVLGLFPRRGFAVRDASARQEAEQRLLSALSPGGRPDAGTAALAVLCAVSGIARSVAPPPSGRTERRALAAHLNGLVTVVGPGVAEILVATRDAYRRNGSSDVFVPLTGDDGYGDSGGDGGGGGGGDGGGGGGGD